MYGVFNQQNEFCHIWSLKISHVCRGDPHGCEGTRNRSALFHSHVLSFMACFDYEKSIGLLLQHTQKQIHWQTHTRWPPPPSPLTLGSQWQQVKTGPTWTGHFWFTGEASLFLRFFLFFIVVSRVSVAATANESRSACAGLLLQARWDSVEMTFGGWPTWCNHNVARDAFLPSFW